MTYKQWIAKFAKHWGDGDGLCYNAVAAMRLSFPQLIIKYGWLLFENGSQQHHWWCETAAGEMVDPTFGQFDWLGKPIRMHVIDNYPPGREPSHQDEDVVLEMHESVTDPKWREITRY